MSERSIFVSCGQLTDAERRLGYSVLETINSHTGFKAYFADTVQSLKALGNHVFDDLRHCSAAVALLHARENGSSPTWINQEPGILAYRQFFESTEIPVLVFKESSVKLEGAMTALIVNAKPLETEAPVIEEVRRWLLEEAVKGRSDEWEVFAQKWAALTADDIKIPKALVAEGSEGIKEISIRRRLINGVDGMDKSTASTLVKTRLLALRNLNLLETDHDNKEIRLHPAWQRYVRHEISKS